MALPDNFLDLLTQNQGYNPGAVTAPSDTTRTPPTAVGPDIDWDRIERSVASVESRRDGGYDLIGPPTRSGDRAHGRFQVMGANVGPWTRQYYGQELTPEEFRRNREAQHAVFRGRFGEYLNRYGNLNDAASLWFTGVPYEQAVREGRSDRVPGQYRGLTVGEYVGRVGQAFGSDGSRMSLGRGGNVADTDETLVTGEPPPTTGVTPGQTPPAGAEPGARGPAGTWAGWLQDPANRAFLISAGVNMMTPTWGGPMASLAAGIGAGAEAASTTERQRYEREFAEAGLRSGETQRELDRRNRLDVANIGAESRADVAYLRTQAMLERARIIGLRTPAQQNEFARQVRSIFGTLMQSTINPNRETADALYERALQMAARAVASGVIPPAAGVTPPTPSGGGTAGETGVVTPPPIATPPPAAVPPPAPDTPLPPPGPDASFFERYRYDFENNPQWGRSRRRTEQPRGEQPPTGGPGVQMTWEQFLAHPSSAAALRNPAARAEILRRRPEWRAQIEALERSGGPGGGQ